MIDYVVIAIPPDTMPTRDQLNHAIRQNIEEPDNIPIACESKTNLVRAYKLSGRMLYDNGELTDEGFETIKTLWEENNKEDMKNVH